MMRILMVALFSLTAFAVQAQSADPQRNGYLLVFGQLTNREALIPYARSLPAIYQQYEGKYLASGGPGNGVRVLESDWTPRSIILAKFPTLDGPNTFWWSPEYRKVVPLRQGAGTFDVLKLKGSTSASSASASGPKPAYLIGIAEVHTPEKIKEYGQKALPLVQQAGAKVIAGGSRKDIELLEGEFGNKQVTIVEFPSLAALREFYTSPAYQALIPIRQAGARYTVIELDGLELPK